MKLNSIRLMAPHKKAKFIFLKIVPVVILCLNTLSLTKAYADETYFADFGFVHVNTPEILAYTITNDGPQMMKLKKFEISGVGFSANSDCDKPVPVKEKCSLEIQFNPPFVGLQSGQLLLEFENDKMIFNLQGDAQ